MTVVSGLAGTTQARRSLFTDKSANDVPDDEEFEELMSVAESDINQATDQNSSKRKRLKQSTLDSYPEENELDDLLASKDEDPWMVGGNAKRCGSQEDMNLQYPESEDELDVMKNEDAPMKLTSTQRVDKRRPNKNLPDVSSIGCGNQLTEQEAEMAHQRLMAVVRKVEEKEAQKVVKDVPRGSTVLSSFGRQDFASGEKSSKLYSAISNTTDRYFIKVLRDEDLRVPSWKQTKKTLLPTSFNDLRLKAYEELQKQSNRHSQVSIGGLKANPVSNAEFESEERDEKEKRRLWVEQYSPKSYLELLSEEFINRALLRWIKLWDKLVFKREVPVNTSSDKLPNSLPTKAAARKFIKEREQSQQQEINTSTGQPVFKVCMLCGAPGLGKTTLAHVLARHAGYNVIEVNASDDRSPELFAKIIENATQMGGGGCIALGTKTTNNGSRSNEPVAVEEDRPKCLIIDEIDGAPEASIKVLLNFVNATGVSSTSKKGKKAKKSRLLKRPIICICNDPYVPALRQLRQQALVLKFPPTSLSRLTSRLTFICRRERLRADKTSLMNLCELAANDIRSCINTLEFIKNKSEVVSTMTIKAAGVGKKNVKKGLFDVWSNIFTMPRAKRSADNQHVNSSANTASYRFSEILTTVSVAGEYERQVAGIFENYPEIPFRDASMGVPSVLVDWLLFFDLSYSFLMTHQTFSLMKFFPFVSVATHLLCAVNRKPKIRFPSTLTELRMGVQRSVNLVQSVLLETSQRLVKQDTCIRLVMETLPFLSCMIKPCLRPVNTLLYTEAEQESLKYTMSIMLSYGLMYRFVPETEIGERYVLDPNIDTIVHFTPEDSEKQKISSETAEIIAREILKSKIRTSSVVSSDVISSSGQPAVRKVNKRSAETLMSMDTSSMAAAKKCVTKTKVARDFFGRVIQPKKTLTTTSASADKACEGGSEKENIKKDSKLLVHCSKVWFKFQEGYSNAVKRNVKMSEFL